MPLPYVAQQLTRRQMLTTVVVPALAAPLAAALVPAVAAAPAALTLVAYSTPREAYDELIPAFQATPEGTEVQVGTSFAASGDQSRAVEGGLPADVLALSLEPDITRLIPSGLVAPDWNADPAHGMITQSLVVFIVRQGNPKQIATWKDLLAEDLKIITPNAVSSGGARWTILAAYGAQIAQGKTAEDATAFVKQLFAHGAPQDKSAREALATFAGGSGDVLLSYENEAITAQQQGQGIEYVIPAQTILIENPVAIVPGSAYPRQAAAFVNFLRSPAGQRIFAAHGYRPVLPAVQAEFDFPAPPQLVTVGDLGGWDEIERTFFAPDTGLVAQIQPH